MIAVNKLPRHASEVVHFQSCEQGVYNWLHKKAMQTHEWERRPIPWGLKRKFLTLSLALGSCLHNYIFLATYKPRKCFAWQMLGLILSHGLPLPLREITLIQASDQTLQFSSSCVMFSRKMFPTNTDQSEKEYSFFFFF